LFLRGAADHLAEGGLAYVLVTWAHGPDGDWSAPLRAWIDGAGCDAIFLRWTSDDPLGYALRWNPPGRNQDAATLGATLDRWLAYDRELGIERLSHGVAILRRRTGENWTMAEDAPERPVPCGEHVERLLAAQDFLGGTDDLAGARLALVPGHVLETTMHVEDGAFNVLSAAIKLVDGLGFAASLDRELVQLISLLDGSRTVRDAAAGSAATPDTLAPVIARLVRMGFLVPAGGDQDP
jgi:hypothetical protein